MVNQGVGHVGHIVGQRVGQVVLVDQLGQNAKAAGVASEEAVGNPHRTPTAGGHTERDPTLV